MHRNSPAMSVVAVLLLVCGGGGVGAEGGADSDASTKGSAAKAAPTKEAAVQLLRDLHRALESKDYDKALTYLVLPKDANAESIKGTKESLAQFIAKNEISAKGIDVLAAHGEWGKLAAVKDQAHAKGRAESLRLPMDECYGLVLYPAEAAFHWDGRRFRVFRCDDVAKIAPDYKPAGRPGTQPG